MILADSRHVTEKVNSTSMIPAAAIIAAGILNVHLTIPMLLKNTAVRGLIIKEQIVSPIIVESMTAGIRLAAV